MTPTILVSRFWGFAGTRREQHLLSGDKPTFMADYQLADPPHIVLVTMAPTRSATEIISDAPLSSQALSTKSRNDALADTWNYEPAI